MQVLNQPKSIASVILPGTPAGAEGAGAEAPEGEFAAAMLDEAAGEDSAEAVTSPQPAETPAPLPVQPLIAPFQLQLLHVPSDAPAAPGELSAKPDGAAAQPLPAEAGAAALTGLQALIQNTLPVAPLAGKAAPVSHPQVAPHPVDGAARDRAGHSVEIPAQGPDALTFPAGPEIKADRSTPAAVGAAAPPHVAQGDLASAASAVRSQPPQSTGAQAIEMAPALTDTRNPGPKAQVADLAPTVRDSAVISSPASQAIAGSASAAAALPLPAKAPPDLVPAAVSNPKAAVPAQAGPKAGPGIHSDPVPSAVVSPPPGAATPPAQASEAPELRAKPEEPASPVEPGPKPESASTRFAYRISNLSPDLGASPTERAARPMAVAAALPPPAPNPGGAEAESAPGVGVERTASDGLGQETAGVVDTAQPEPPDPETASTVQGSAAPAAPIPAPTGAEALDTVAAADLSAEPPAPPATAQSGALPTLPAVALPLHHPHATAHHILMQLAAPMAKAPHGEQVELVLEPAELGQVRFELRLHGDATLVVMSAERAETMDLLRRHVGELQQELLAQGILDASFAFNGWGQDRPADGAPSEAPPAGADPRNEDAPAPPAPLWRPSPGNLAGAALNIRL